MKVSECANLPDGNVLQEGLGGLEVEGVQQNVGELAGDATVGEDRLVGVVSPEDEVALLQGFLGLVVARDAFGVKKVKK